MEKQDGEGIDVTHFDGSFASSGSACDVLFTPYNEKKRESLTSPNLKFFTFNELEKATRNFSPEKFLVQSGQRDTYVGWINERRFSPLRFGWGKKVAVKNLSDCFLGHREWLSEVDYLSQLRHPNLVELIGLCSENDKRLLVYKFMPEGSFGYHLFRSSVALCWSIRIKVAIEAAKGLLFLHENQVIHQDVGASNILLDSEYNAKLSSFCLPCRKFGYTAPDCIGTEVPQRLSWPVRVQSAIEYVKALSSLSQCEFVHGDIEALDILLDSLDSVHLGRQLSEITDPDGYVAPECFTFTTGYISPKSDVYSFGVVLLELLSGRQADASRGLVERDLVHWAKKFLYSEQNIFGIMDPKLEGEYPIEGAFALGQLALQCFNSAPMLRPSMAVVLAVLEKPKIQGLKKTSA